MTNPLFHGGVAGLKVGDTIQPGHERPMRDGCPFCIARAAGGAHHGIDPLSAEHAVYATTDRLYAKHYASLWGRGDLYRVSAIGEATPSREDTIPTVHAPKLRVEAILERAVLLTPSDRRRLLRTWTAADLAAGSHLTPTQIRTAALAGAAAVSPILAGAGR